MRLRGDVQTETDAIRIELPDPPSKPTSPAAPNRPLFLTSVLLAGIGGIGAVFGLAQVRTSYATAAKLERASGLPVIGSITEVVTGTSSAACLACQRGRGALSASMRCCWSPSSSSVAWSRERGKGHERPTPRQAPACCSNARLTCSASIPRSMP